MNIAMIILLLRSLAQFCIKWKNVMSFWLYLECFDPLICTRRIPLLIETFNIKMLLTSLGNRVVETRRYDDRLISMMRFPIMVRYILSRTQNRNAPHPPVLLPLPAFSSQVFLEFARHQLEEGNHDLDDERAAAAMKTRALMRQHSVQIGDSSGSGIRAGSLSYEPMPDDGDTFYSVRLWK